jgi:hypothetical protein
MWVRREVAFALQDPRYEDRIVPLKYRECDLKSVQWLTLFQMVDFAGVFADGCRDLLRIWGIGLREEHLQQDGGDSPAAQNVVDRRGKGPSSKKPRRRPS